MWNREEEKDDVSADRSGGAGSESGRSDGAPADQAIIGHSIRIQGEVTGDEDLTIQGYVDGSVNLEQHAVTVGPDGEVDANIVARVITVEGAVDGDLRAEEQVVVRSSAHVEGDISAPRVVLEDGAHFRGGVDMDEVSDGGRAGSGGSGTSRGRSGSGLATRGSASDDEVDGDEDSDGDDES